MIALGFVLLAVNAVAFMQAWKMTHFQPEGSRTGAIEKLGPLQKVRLVLFGVVMPRPAIRKTPGEVGLKSETVTIPSSDGLRLEAWLVKSPRSKGTVVLFHGYGACKSDCVEEALEFNQMGYTTLLLDFRGSGGSDGNYTSIGYDEADDVSAALDYARKLAPGKPVILYGKSMGSASILCACERKGIKPDALIMECPFDRMLSTAANRFASMGLSAFPFAHLLIFWGGAQHGFWAFSHNPVAYARSANTPTLLMAGLKDNRVTERQARSIYDNLAGPKRFVVFPEAGHTSFLGSDKEKWRSAITDFLKRESTASATADSPTTVSLARTP